MEDQAQNGTIDQELGQLWSRFEGLVGNQLHRLKEDKAPPKPDQLSNVSPCTNACLEERFDGSATCEESCSSICRSMITSHASIDTPATSPARLETAGKPLANLACAVSYDSNICGGAGGSTATSSGEEQQDNAHIDDFDRTADSESSSNSGPIRGRSADCSSEALIDRDDTSGIHLGSCLLTEKEDALREVSEDDSPAPTTSVSSAAQISARRNSSCNAINTSDTQQLFGLPYVARAVGPLLNLVMVTLEEMDGHGDGHSSSWERSEERRRECKRTMLGVYKQSLLLESQLHQYLNPGLVTSLNRRVARATFEADTMTGLIEKLNKQYKKAGPNSDRHQKIQEAITKLRALLARQKCEWQCVGRLKETLTMGREMKELLRFVAKLSNILEQNKTAFGGLHDRPPPYDYCGPYNATEDWQAAQPQLNQGPESSENQTATSHTSKSGAKDDGLVGDKLPSYVGSNELSAKSATGNCKNKSQEESLREVTRTRSRSESPKKSNRIIEQRRSLSTDADVESYSSISDDVVRPCVHKGALVALSSGAALSETNSNASNLDELEPSGTCKATKRLYELPERQMNTIKEERFSTTRKLFYNSETSTFTAGDRIYVTKQLAEQCALRMCQDNACREPAQQAPVARNDQRENCRNVESKSPPRACPNVCPVPPRETPTCPRPPPNQCNPCRLRTPAICCPPPPCKPKYVSLPSRLKMFGPAPTSRYGLVGDDPSSNKEASNTEADTGESESQQEKTRKSEARWSQQSEDGSPLKSDDGEARSSSRKSMTSKDSELLSQKDSKQSEFLSKEDSKQSKSLSKKDSKQSESLSKKDSKQSEFQSKKDSKCKDEALDVCCSEGDDDKDCGCNCSEGSGSVCIDIQSNTKPTKSPCPSHRRICVKVKRRSCSGSPKGKKEVFSDEEVPPSKDDGIEETEPIGVEEQKKKSSVAESSVAKSSAAVVEEKEPSEVGKQKGNSSVAESSVAESSAAKSSAAESSVAKSSAAKSSAAVVEEKEPSEVEKQKRKSSLSVVKEKGMEKEDKSDGSLPPTKAGEDEETDENERGAEPSESQEETEKKGSVFEEYQNGLMKMAKDEPWKLALLALLLLYLLYLIFMWLFSSCCGCRIMFNPLFFLTNSLAGNVELRHVRPPPT